jgi:ribosomal protein S27AE
MAVKALECPKCGASLALVAGQQSYTCGYCRTHFTSTSAPAPAPAQAPPSQARPPHDPAAAGRVVTRVLVTSMVMTAVIGIGVTMLVTRTRSDFAQVIAESMPGVTMPAMPGMPVVPKAGGRSLWDDVGGAPLPAQVAGQAAVLGRIRAFPEDQLYIVAARAADAGTIYQVGPLGTYGDGYRATHFAALGERLVVSDLRPTLRVVELASGEALKEFPLSDRVEAMCTVEGATEIGIALVDERRLRLDPVALTLEEGAPPKGCVLDGSPFRRHKDPPGVKAPKVEGFRGEQIVAEGRLAVSNGHKDPGTAIPQAVGFDPKTGAQRWREVIPSVAPASVQERSNEHAALAGGRFFTIYKVGSEDTHVAAFDAESGARLWDHQLRPIFAVDKISGVVATKEHVFVVRTSSLDILEAASGGAAGDGRRRYVRPLTRRGRG